MIIKKKIYKYLVQLRRLIVLSKINKISINSEIEEQIEI